MKTLLIVSSLALLAPATTALADAPANGAGIQLVDDSFGVQTPLGTFSLSPNNQQGYYPNGPGYAYGPGYSNAPGYYGQGYGPPGGYYANPQQQHVHLRLVPPNGGSLFVYQGNQVVARVDQPQTIELAPQQQFGVVATRGGSTLWSGFIPGSSRRVDVVFGQSDTPSVSTRGPSAFPGYGGGYYAPGTQSPNPPGYYGPNQGYYPPGQGYYGDHD